MLELTHPLDSADALKRMRTAKSESARRQWQVLYLAAETGVLKPELGKATKRVHAAWIAEQTGYTPSGVGQIVCKFNRKGLEMFDESLRKRPNAGHPGALNKERKRELVTRLLETTEEVSLEEICAFTQKEFGVKISKSTARRYREGFKDWKLPPPPEPEPQAVAAPAKPEKQTPLEKPVTVKQTGKHSYPESETTEQKPKSAMLFPLPEPESPSEKLAQADRKVTRRKISKKERLERQQPTLFESTPDD